MNNRNKQIKDIENKKGKSNSYLLVFMIVIILMRFVNEISSNISTYTQSAIINEFYVSKGISYDDGLLRYTPLSMLFMALCALTFLYKPLADKIGRRRTLMINVCCFGIGMFLCYSAKNIYVYLLGVAIFTFFTQNDVQMVYILETAPKDKSARMFSTVKSIGILGLLFVPILREKLLNNDLSLWRNLYLFPVILCVVVFICFVLFMKESDAFVDNREENEDSQSLNTKQAIKYILSNEDILMPVIANTFYGTCSLSAYSYVDSIMSINGLSSSDITKAMYVYPFVYAFECFIAGRIADKFGRRIVVSYSGVFVATGFIGFILGCINGINPYLIGLIEGLYLGSFWVFGDYISVLLIDKVPVNIRTSIISAASILTMIGSTLGIVLQMILLKLFGLNIASIAIIVPFITISTLIIMFKVKESRGV